MPSRDVVVAMTGASGSIYAIRLITTLLAADQQVHLITSAAARQVLTRELETEFPPTSAAESAWREMMATTLTASIARQWGFTGAVALDDRTSELNGS